ncbi:beta-lactamase family protein [Paenibacillus sp. 481]|nr:beta-lactamase family protein [Paenibacillus sp. 481]
MLSLTVLLTSATILTAGGGAVLAAAGTTGATGDTTATNANTKAATNQSIHSTKSGQHNELNRTIVQALKEGVAKGIPGVLFVTNKDGVAQHYTSGSANLFSERSMKTDFHFRIGSITKTFVSVTLLQLVGEGKLSLDDSVEKWLPGLVQGNGYKGSDITVRQVLNHSSGIASYTDEAFMKKLYENRFKSFTSEELVKVGIQQKPLFAPGAKSSYSNTNYIIAGMIIEKVTGQSSAEQIKQRIIEPLKLKNTSVPGSVTKLPEPHARGYYQHKAGGPLEDFTELNVTAASTSGGMISTADDLNRFITAVINGKLLKPEQMKELQHTLPLPEAGGSYGLGIIETQLPNGVKLWGHAGGIQGFRTYTFVTSDGKHAATMSINYHGNDLNAVMTELLMKVYEAEFSAVPASKP